MTRRRSPAIGLIAPAIALAGVLALDACDWLWPLEDELDSAVEPTADSRIDTSPPDEATLPRDGATLRQDQGVTPPGKCVTAAGWSKRLGSTLDEIGRGVAIDADNVYLTGEFRGTADFDTRRLISAGDADIFLASFGCDGTLRWIKRFGGAGVDLGRHLALDANSNIYVTGSFSGTADFDGQQLVSAGIDDGFICSFTSGGDRRWCQRFGATAADKANMVAVDGQSNVYLAAQFGGTVSISGGTAVTSGGGLDGLLCSLTSGGSYRWCQQIGGAADASGWVVAAQGSGPIYFAAFFQGTATYDGGSVTSGGNDDILLCRFTTAGKREWCKSFSGTGTDYPEGAAIDSAGNLYLTGKFQNSLTFGGSTLTSAGGWDGFLVSLDATGAPHWSKRIGGAGTDYGMSVQLVGNTLYTGGEFSGTVQFDGQPLTSAGSTDAYVCSFKSTGERNTCRRWGGSGEEILLSLAVASSGHLHLTGSFGGSAAMGGAALRSAGGQDIFLSRIAP